MKPCHGWPSPSTSKRKPYCAAEARSGGKQAISSVANVRARIGGGAFSDLVEAAAFGISRAGREVEGKASGAGTWRRFRVMEG